MGGHPGRFWGSAAIASILVAGAVAWAGPLVLRLDPRPGFRPLTSGEFWLLTVFTLGVLAVLLGIAVGFGGWLRGSLLGEVVGPEASRLEGRPLDEAASEGVREGGVPGADEHERRPRIDPAWWTAAVGLHLLAIYWAGWWLLG